MKTKKSKDNSAIYNHLKKMYWNFFMAKRTRLQHCPSTNWIHTEVQKASEAECLYEKN